MRSTYTAEQVLGSRSRLRVLRVLFGVKIPLNASQIAARAHLSQPAAATVLRELASMGVVTRTPAGRAWVHQLVRDNVYTETMVAPVFAAEWGIPETLLEELDAALGSGAVSLVLFGSYARGEQDEASDIDVAVVAADAPARAVAGSAATEAAERFRRRFGAALSVLVYETAEAAFLHLDSPALYDEIERDAVVIRGLAPHEWRQHGQEG